MEEKGSWLECLYGVAIMVSRVGSNIGVKGRSGVEACDGLRRLSLACLSLTVWGRGGGCEAYVVLHACRLEGTHADIRRCI